MLAVCTACVGGLALPDIGMCTLLCKACRLASSRARSVIGSAAAHNNREWISFNLTQALRWLPQVFASVPACIQLLEGPYLETHDAVVKAFRPAGLVRACRKDGV